MKVSEIMKRVVGTCRPQQTLRDAARLMFEAATGCLPVLDEESDAPIGVITDRDICRAAMIRGTSLDRMTVEEAMTRGVLGCAPGHTLDEAAVLMRSYRVRRLPVISRDGAVIGLVSLGDIAREAEREHDAELDHEIEAALIAVAA